MASLHQHMEDCQRFLGSQHEGVHRWLDEFFATAGAKHRKFRHHREGIREARGLFGEDGARAATVHILRDCRNIPSAEDYETGTADNLGLKAAWPVSAYVHYTEEAFSALVKYMLDGPMAVLLWVFFRNEVDLANLLAGVSRLSDDQQREHLSRWDQAVSRCKQISENPIGIASFRDADGPTLDYFKEVSAFLPGVVGQSPDVRFAMVPIEQLITPLTLIDYEYVEELKATLTGTESRDLASFAVPKQLQIQAKTAVDPSGRSINIISTQKMLTVGPLIVSPLPGLGFEVKVNIVGTPQLILVSHVAGRLYLRGGIHRAYLLASLGVKEVPCILIDEGQIPFVMGTYPTFAPHILALPRPPLLIDTLDPTLTLLIPMVRTNKIIRISAEELILPVG
jgi:hypothetical protein